MIDSSDYVPARFNFTTQFIRYQWNACLDIVRDSCELGDRGPNSAPVKEQCSGVNDSNVMKERPQRRIFHTELALSAHIKLKLDS